MNLTFGEQVKIILGRKGMTIKELAERMQAYTGKPMSRQNMTQRLGRDNFQEQDMRMIAEILGCKLTLELIEDEAVETVTEAPAESASEEVATESAPVLTVGDILDAIEVQKTESEPELSEQERKEQRLEQERELLKKGIRGYFKKASQELRKEEVKEEPTEILGEINPYTGKEYLSNSVRMHPKRIGYVQVYDQEKHQWSDMTEWAFLGYQERKKKLLGKDYKEPIYLD